GNVITSWLVTASGRQVICEWFYRRAVTSDARHTPSVSQAPHTHTCTHTHTHTHTHTCTHTLTHTHTHTHTHSHTDSSLDMPFDHLIFTLKRVNVEAVMISSRSFVCPHYKEQPPEPLPRPCWLNHTTQHSLSLNNLNCLSIANLVSCLHRLLSKTSPILSPSRLVMVSFMSSSSLPVSVSLLLSPHCLPPSLFFSFLSSSSSPIPSVHTHPL